jgi:DNA-binding transcriptional MerR regulator
MLQVFTACEVVRITGVPYSTLTCWDHADILHPSVSSATGSGSRRLYSIADLIAIRAIRGLRQNGISVPAIREILDRFRQRSPGDRPPGARGARGWTRSKDQRTMQLDLSRHFSAAAREALGKTRGMLQLSALRPSAKPIQRSRTLRINKGRSAPAETQQH